MRCFSVYFVALATLLAIGGCDLFGDEEESLPIGTFRFEFDDETVNGNARFGRTSGRFGGPALLLGREGELVLSIETERLFSAEEGTSLEPDYATVHWTRAGENAYEVRYGYVEGTLKVRDRTQEQVAGSFSF